MFEYFENLIFRYHQHSQQVILVFIIHILKPVRHGLLKPKLALKNNFLELKLFQQMKPTLHCL
jgi:hypothetical protein